MWTFYLLAAAVGYLLGSFPTGYLAGRSKGIDIREHGSGNIGATNVVRVLGKKIGALVFFGDALKGLLAVGCGEMIALYGWLQLHGSSEAEAAAALYSRMHPMVLGGIVAALGCIMGHNFPVWLRFRGGKGIATSAGALLGLMPLATLAAAAVWAAAFYTLRYVSVASLLAAAALPLVVLLLWRVGWADPALIWFSLLAAALAVWRHRSNIQRLLNGTEPRFARKAKAAAPEAGA